MTAEFRQYLSLWSGPSKKWHETIFTSFPASTFSGHLQKIAEGQSESCLFSKEGGEGSWMESGSTWLCVYSITLFSRTVWFSVLIGWGIRIHQKASEGSGFDYLSYSCISAYLAVFFERICKIKRLCFPSLAEEYKRGEILPYDTLRYSPIAF